MLSPSAQLANLSLNSPTATSQVASPFSHKRKRSSDTFPSTSTSAKTQPAPDSGLIRCICGYTDDDGLTIFCDMCGYWQHMSCVLNTNTDEDNTSEDDVSSSTSSKGKSKPPPAALPDQWFCERCVPRPVDARSARARQTRRLQADRDRELREAADVDVVGGRRRSRAEGDKRRRSSANNSPTETSSVSRRPKNATNSRKPHSTQIFSQLNNRHRSSSVDISPADEEGVFEPWSNEYTRITSDLITDESVQQALRRWREGIDTSPPETNNCSRRPSHANGHTFNISPLTACAPLPSPTQGKYQNYRVQVKSVPAADCVPLPSPAVCSYLPYSTPSYQDKNQSVDLPPSKSTTSASYGRPPTYGLYTAPRSSPPYSSSTIIPAGTLLTTYASHVIPLSSYTTAPLSQYTLLHLPKPHVRLIPAPLSLALDAREMGNESRFIRNGCHPNSVIRPVLSDSSPNGVAWGVYSTRDLSTKGEEIVLGWEWDRASAVHRLGKLLEHGCNDLEDEIELKAQMCQILCTLGGTFTSCACGRQQISGSRDCVFIQMSRFICDQSRFSFSHIDDSTINGGKPPKAFKRSKGVKAELGPMIGWVDSEGPYVGIQGLTNDHANGNKYGKNHHSHRSHHHHHLSNHLTNDYANGNGKDFAHNDMKPPSTPLQTHVAAVSRPTNSKAWANIVGLYDAPQSTPPPTTLSQVQRDHFPPVSSTSPSPSPYSRDHLALPRISTSSLVASESGSPPRLRGSFSPSWPSSGFLSSPKTVSPSPREWTSIASRTGLPLRRATSPLIGGAALAEVVEEARNEEGDASMEVDIDVQGGGNEEDESIQSVKLPPRMRKRVQSVAPNPSPTTEVRIDLPRDSNDDTLMSPPPPPISAVLDPTTIHSIPIVSLAPIEAPAIIPTFATSSAISAPSSPTRQPSEPFPPPTYAVPVPLVSASATSDTPDPPIIVEPVHAPSAPELEPESAPPPSEPAIKFKEPSPQPPPVRMSFLAWKRKRWAGKGIFKNNLDLGDEVTSSDREKEKEEANDDVDIPDIKVEIDAGGVLDIKEVPQAVPAVTSIIDEGTSPLLSANGRDALHPESAPAEAEGPVVANDTKMEDGSSGAPLDYAIEGSSGSTAEAAKRDSRTDVVEEISAGQIPADATLKSPEDAVTEAPNPNPELMTPSLVRAARSPSLAPPSLALPLPAAAEPTPVPAVSNDMEVDSGPYPLRTDTKNIMSIETPCPSLAVDVHVDDTKPRLLVPLSTTISPSKNDPAPITVVLPTSSPDAEDAEDGEIPSSPHDPIHPSLHIPSSTQSEQSHSSSRSSTPHSRPTPPLRGRVSPGDRNRSNSPYWDRIPPPPLPSSRTFLPPGINSYRPSSPIDSHSSHSGSPRPPYPGGPWYDSSRDRIAPSATSIGERDRDRWNRNSWQATTGSHYRPSDRDVERDRDSYAAYNDSSSNGRDNGGHWDRRDREPRYTGREDRYVDRSDRYARDKESRERMKQRGIEARSREAEVYKGRVSAPNSYRPSP